MVCHIRNLKTIKMKKNYTLAFTIAITASTVLFSCKKDDTTPAPTVVKQWSIALSAKNENPAPAGRNETGTATVELLSDNSLKYTIAVTGLAGADALTASHLHVGNVITNGGVILDLKPTFAGGNASGTITDLRTTLVDSLKNDVNEIYFNVHSTQVASGLVRGQMNVKLEMVADVILSGLNEVPAVTTTATGLALVRLTANKQLYTRVTVTNLEATDALTAAHIHKAATGVNGAVMIGLCSNAADFNTIKTVTVDDATFASLKADALYVNAHSTNRPSGVVRGQIR